MSFGSGFSLERAYLNDLYKGDIAYRYFCSKVDSDYRLFFVGNRQTTNGLEGKMVSDDGTFMNKSFTWREKGKYIELKMGNFEKVPIFKPKTKVLALKPLGNFDFEKKFTFATVVSGPTPCERIYHGSSFGGNSIIPSRERMSKRNTYSLKFKGEKMPCTVYEEFIVPTEDYWNKEKEIYGPDSDSSDYSDSSSSSSDYSDSSSSSSTKEKSKHKSHHRKHHRDNKHKKHNKHHHKGSKSPKIIILPIFIPFSQPQQFLPY